ncbi:MAG: TetR/AcrR family transcriptional regulator [Longimicrobiales bacterium]|nr:TetR/AcrR family transcriptional regulator [Longimicrobiales bacterium]
MPRTPAYDRTEALDHAVRVFWEKGYWDTSIADLVEATGVQRYGLYASFGDKHGLFLEALERYHDTVLAGLLRELERPGAALPEVEAYLERLAAIAKRPGASRGCLICNTAAELGEDDPDVAARVGAYTGRLTGAFRAALIRARALGQVPDGLNADEAARFLTGVVVGASVYARTPRGGEAVPALLTVAARALRG